MSELQASMLMGFCYFGCWMLVLIYVKMCK